MSVWRRWLPLAWSVALALVLLGPALGRGYVLSYDMVWVPDLALRRDFLGLGSALPRAVPSDAVVGVLDTVVPGLVLQKLLLVGCLVGGGLGAARLAPPDSLTGRLVAVTVYQWNPFVAERLLIGHWPVLVTYAVLPWLLDAGRRWRMEGILPARLLVLMPLACLSASGGLAAAIVLAAATLSRRAPRRSLAVLALALAANAPWFVSGLLHAGSATTDGAGAAAFALNGEGSVPGPLAALGLGGIWNTEVVPPSHEGLVGWLFLALLLGLAVLGARSWGRSTAPRDRSALVVCWCLGWGLAVLTWAAPGAVGWVVGQVPGAGLLRDGGRLLLLCAPLLTALVAAGAAEVTRRVARSGAGLVPGVSLALALVLAPVALLPDAALGLSGRLRPATFPASYAQARTVVADAADVADDQPGDVLVLPLTSYRQPTWNHDHKVLDPLGRFLTPDYVAGDSLVVSGVEVAGEDPRVRDVRRALARPSAALRARALGALGIGFVAHERDVAGSAPAVEGTVLLTTPDLVVTRISGVEPRHVAASWYVAMATAWTLFAGSLVLGVALALRRRLLRAP